jgi:shikimate kinase
MMEDVTAAPTVPSREARAATRTRSERSHVKLVPRLARTGPLVVELVGAWGAGKSSLVAALTRRDDTVRAAPPVWVLPKRLLALGALQTIATAVHSIARGWRLEWKDARRLVRLRALCHHLKILRAGGGIVVVEDGPALILAWLREAAGRSDERGVAPWWRSAIERWVKTVDVVVFLDASEAVLARRVLARTQDNPFKDRPEAELSETLKRSREAYERVLADLPAFRGPTVLPFRTDRTSIARITDELMVALEREPDGR